MPDVLFFCNLKGEILDVNQTACVRYGFKKEEFKNLDFRYLISEKSIPEFDSKIELLNKNKNLLTEVEHVDRDGNLKPAELVLKTNDNKNENVILIFSRDITIRKQNEQKQRTNEELYKKVFEFANETIYIFDHRGYIVLANSHCMKMTGYSLEELMSNPIINLVYPEDKEYVSHKMNERLFGDKTNYAYSFRMNDKKGNIKWVYQNLVGIIWDGKPAGLCVSYDITEIKDIEAALRESEEKYRLVVEKANEGIFIIQDGRIVFSNQFVRNILGYRNKELNKEHFTSLIHPDDKDIVLANFSRRMEGKFIPMYFSRVKKKTGDVFHPCEFIKDEMEAQDIKQADLVKESGFNKSLISLLLSGKRNITISIALVLEKVLNVKAETWIRLQKHYELNKELIELKNLKSA